MRKISFLRKVDRVLNSAWSSLGIFGGLKSKLNWRSKLFVVVVVDGVAFRPALNINLRLLAMLLVILGRSGSNIVILDDPRNGLRRLIILQIILILILEKIIPFLIFWFWIILPLNSFQLIMVLFDFNRRYTFFFFNCYWWTALWFWFFSFPIISQIFLCSLTFQLVNVVLLFWSRLAVLFHNLY